MYWGNITSTIDFCESNYAVSPYIAEFWNTLSNIGYLGFGAYGLYRYPEAEPRFRAAFLWLFLVGVGSTCLHGTLKWLGQMSDELSMFVLSLVLIYVLIEHTHYTPRYPNLPWILVAGWVFGFSIYAILGWNLLFQSMWLSLTIGIGYRFHSLLSNFKDKDRWNYYFLYGIFALAGVSWLFDQVLCDSVRDLYLHAIGWHLGTSIGGFAIITGLYYLRLKMLHPQQWVELQYQLGFLPVIAFKGNWD